MKIKIFKICDVEYVLSLKLEKNLFLNIDISQKTIFNIMRYYNNIIIIYNNI